MHVPILSRSTDDLIISFSVVSLRYLNGYYLFRLVSYDSSGPSPVAYKDRSMYVRASAFLYRNRQTVLLSLALGALCDVTVTGSAVTSF